MKIENCMTENFTDKGIEIYKLDPANFLSAPGLAWQACLKKTGVKLDVLIDNDMLLMVEEEIKVGMCQAVYRYAKANNKYMKNIIIALNLHIQSKQMQIICMDGQCHKN